MSAEYPPKEELERRRQAEQVVSGGHTTENVQAAPPKPGRRMSAVVLRLADRLGVDPDELAAHYPDDTLRRTKYPVIEEIQDDGSVLYKHNPVRP